MKNRHSIIVGRRLIGLFVGAVLLWVIQLCALAQNKPSPLQCTKSNPSNEPMTYLVGSSKLGKADRKRINATFGKLIIPEGETERAKELRRIREERDRNLRAGLQKSFDDWLKRNPGASEQDRKVRQDLVATVIENMTASPETKRRLALPRWDWRDKGIDVGSVYNQGINCNTCWAFAAASAADTSIQKSDEESINGDNFILNMDRGELYQTKGGMFFTLGDPGPFAQDLLNCMPIEEEDICQSGWHGRAFDFMVFGRGIPMVYRDGFVEDRGKKRKFRRIYSPGRKFACSPNNGFKQALAWDYVTSPPDRQPTVAEMKEALIKHGPIVAPITFSDCLVKYRGGVFNENDTDKINHVVLLIGWDDAKQAWLVKNSWGTEWGEKGFGWIKYGSSNIGVFAAWIDVEDQRWGLR